MSQNYTWDALENQGSQPGLWLPYNTIERKLSDFPRLVAGNNTYIDTGGALIRRFGTLEFPANTTTVGGRVDRAVIYETLDGYVYLVMSVFTGTYWELYYLLLDGSSDPTQVTEKRNCNHSTTPHEMVDARGLLYVTSKQNGDGAGNLGNGSLPSIVIDGSGGTISAMPWGVFTPYNGQTGISHILSVKLNLQQTMLTTALNATDTSGYTYTFAAATYISPTAPFVILIDYEQINVTGISSSGVTQKTITVTASTRGYNGTIATTHANSTPVYILYDVTGATPWATATSAFVVNQFWKYAYTPISSTGQYGNRTIDFTRITATGNPVTNQTPPFFNQIPSMTLLDSASHTALDSTDFPSVAVFRTTDGGGTYYLLDVIDNTDGGTGITYTDNLKNNTIYGTGTELDGPVPDSLLTTIGASLVTNGPPPNNIAPSTVGTSNSAQTTPLAYFQGRIWYGIGNILFFSAQEETVIGVPEECFPSGITGNFFRFQERITNVHATTQGLYVFTLTKTYLMTGSTLDSFSYAPILNNIGHPTGHARAVDVFDDNVVWLTNDYRIGLLDKSGVFHTLSDALGTEISDAIMAGGEADIKYFGYQDKEWIVVAVHNNTTPTLSRQWVYDINKSNPQPGEARSVFWNTPWTYPSCCLVSGRTSDSDSASYLQLLATNTANDTTQLSYMSPGTTTDFVVGGATTYDISATINLSRVPAGDHVNQRRVPGITPVLYSVLTERLSYAGDSDPDFSYYVDDLWNSPQPVFGETPARIPQTNGYVTTEYPIFVAGKRWSFVISKTSSYDNFSLQDFDLIFEPDAGA